MKRFACGDVVPGCLKVFHADSVERILDGVAQHAREDHGMTEIPASLVEAVKQKVTDSSVNG
ncbi:DUF1059 domain-containing protein [Terriglobus tenax]|uniref:DUF1059 domain-containing protein n=1 Tax=Terriglobus tenax TaxID=1111115 RepID=UPI0021E00BC6|nr:DUF1059 domain-containing protein [Terriglobus tenax]